MQKGVCNRGIEFGLSGVILVELCMYTSECVKLALLLGGVASLPLQVVLLLYAGFGYRPELVKPFFSSWVSFYPHQFSDLVYCMDKKTSR